MHSRKIQYHVAHITNVPNELHESFHVNISDTAELFITIGFTEIVQEALCKNTLYSIVQTIQNTLFSASKDELYEKFEAAIKSLNVFFHKKDLSSLGHLHVAIGLLEDDAMYITKTGRGEIYLVRKNTFTNVTENFDEEHREVEDSEVTGEENEEKKDMFVNIATGDLEQNDILLLSSSRLTKFMRENEVTALFTKANIEIGFINLEHRLKDDASASISLIGFQYSAPVIVPEEKESKNEKVILEKTRMPRLKMSTVLTHIKKHFPEGKFSVDGFKEMTQSVYTAQKEHVLNPKYRTKYILLGIVVIMIVLIVNINHAVTSNKTSEMKATVSATYNEAKQELSTASRLTIAGNREEARTHLEAATKLMFELKSMPDAGAAATTLMEEISKVETDAYKIKKLTEDDMFIDLNNKIQKDDVKGLVAFDEKIYVYSSSGIYGPFINNTTNTNNKYALENTNMILDATYFDDIKGVILKLSPAKIGEFINNSIIYSDTTATTWKEGALISTFGSNMYILGENQVWKYTRNKNNYRGPSPWLQKPDNSLKNVVSFAFDGAMYALSKEGKIKKYFQGKPVDAFTIVDAPADVLSGIDERSKIATQTDWTHAFVLNHSSNKIISFIKGKNTSNQFVFDQQFAFDKMEIISMAVSNDEKTIFVLGNNMKIYKISL